MNISVKDLLYQLGITDISADVKRLGQEIEFLKASNIKSRSEEILTYDAFNRNSLFIKDLQDEITKLNAKVSQLDESLTRHTRYSTTLRDNIKGIDDYLQQVTRQQKKNNDLTDVFIERINNIQERLDRKEWSSMSYTTENCNQKLPEPCAFAQWLVKKGWKSIDKSGKSTDYHSNLWRREDSCVYITELYELFSKENGNLK